MKAKLYAKPGCGVCQVVKRYLDQNGVRYREFDVSRDPDALQEMVNHGLRTVPVTVFGETAIAGFDKARLDQEITQLH